MEAICQKPYEVQGMDKSQLRVGVREGAGAPPGYSWSIVFPDFVPPEAMKLIGEFGYEHLAMQMRELARCEEPTSCETVDVRPIADYYEIRDKGAPFGGANVRLFFAVDKTNRCLVPLGAIKKQNDGPTPLGDKIRMSNRWRRYQNGEYGDPSSCLLRGR